jgi:hypothetical protein
MKLGLPRPLGGDWRRWAETLLDNLARPGQIYATSLAFNRPQAADVEAGALSYYSDDDTLVLGHDSGAETHLGLHLQMRGTNNTGSTITKGSFVTATATGATGGEVQIEDYIADNTLTDPYFGGIAAEDITNGSTGWVTTYGKVRDIDTSSFTAGDLVYASAATAGALTATAPTAPDNVILVGIVLVSNASKGEVFVRREIVE